MTPFYFFSEDPPLVLLGTYFQCKKHRLLAADLIYLPTRNKSAIVAGSPLPQTNNELDQQPTPELQPRARAVSQQPRLRRLTPISAKLISQQTPTVLEPNFPLAPVCRHSWAQPPIQPFLDVYRLSALSYQMAKNTSMKKLRATKRTIEHRSRRPNLLVVQFGTFLLGPLQMYRAESLTRIHRISDRKCPSYLNSPATVNCTLAIMAFFAGTRPTSRLST